MTISVMTNNSNGDDQRGEDRSMLPDLSSEIAVISGDTESEVKNIKGLHAVGLILPAAITGMTGIELHVSNKEDGTYAKLAQSGEFTLGTLQAVGSAFIAEWNYLKVVYVGTVTGTATIPLSFG